ncbi:MAG: hypothetical protein ACR2G4_00980 [Pyrinomonadaceae bacterium]
MRKERQRLVFPREVLLVEIERHCAECDARTRKGLTKEEARLYDGFECQRCERWNADSLTERDIPDWWEELTITGLDTLRARLSANEPLETGEAGSGGDVVVRLSEAWRRKEKSAAGMPDEGDEPR